MVGMKWIDWTVLHFYVLYMGMWRHRLSVPYEKQSCPFECAKLLIFDHFHTKTEKTDKIN